MKLVVFFLDIIPILGYNTDKNVASNRVSDLAVNILRFGFGASLHKGNI